MNKPIRSIIKIAALSEIEENMSNSDSNSESSSENSVEYKWEKVASNFRNLINEENIEMENSD